MIGQVEDAIIRRLEAASGAGHLGYRLRCVESMPTDLDGHLAKAVQDYPAFWVAYGGWKVRAAFGDGSSKVDATFHVVAAARSLRNERAQRRGAVGEVGSYQMVLDAVALLIGQDFGLPIGGLQVGECKPLYTGAGRDQRPVSLFAVAFTTELLIEPGAFDRIVRPSVGDFETFDVAWEPALSQSITLPTQES